MVRATASFRRWVLFRRRHLSPVRSGAPGVRAGRVGAPAPRLPPDGTPSGARTGQARQPPAAAEAGERRVLAPKAAGGALPRGVRSSGVLGEPGAGSGRES